MKKVRRVRMMIDFHSEAAMLAWFEEAGTLLFRWGPGDVGLREADSLDLTADRRTYIVKRKSDGGRFLVRREHVTTEIVLEDQCAPKS